MNIILCTAVGWWQHHFQEKLASGVGGLYFGISFLPFYIFETVEKLIFIFAESRNGAGEPINGVNPVYPVGLSSFDPNPSANLVSVGREGD